MPSFEFILLIIIWENPYLLCLECYRAHKPVFIKLTRFYKLALFPLKTWVIVIKKLVESGNQLCLK